VSEDVLETPWEGRFLSIKKRGKWEYAARARDIHAAAIVAIEDGHVFLVEQYRVPLGMRCLELPAGLVGDDVEGEEIERAANRELEEEVGYRAGRMIAAGRFSSSPGMTSETFTLMIAKDLVKVGEGGGVPGENITVHRVPLGDVAGFCEAKRAEGLMIDVKLLLLLGAGLIAG
jgi:ADP-ribose pyrophosphatase